MTKDSFQAWTPVTVMEFLDPQGFKKIVCQFIPLKLANQIKNENKQRVNFQPVKLQTMAAEW
jgi:hypothetical protein